MDIEHITDYTFEDRARRVRHGVVLSDTMGDPTINPAGDRYVSAGGFWPHKGMKELAEAWEASKMDQELWLFGYGMEENAPPVTGRVKVFK